MKSGFSASSLLLVLFLFAQTALGNTETELLARKALSENITESTAAISELRAAGPAGLETLFQVYADEINRQIASPKANPEWQRLSAVLDAVSRQRNSYLSGLYWYTDFEQAKAAARATGKPILSLRLLGNLDEEFTCANSRFFRTILYSNAEISKLLRERFVLHWQSVRPVPRVTIDFGDGRKLERTITGNSIHYVLDSDGLPIDALPGLYGPQAFLNALAATQNVFARIKGMDDVERGKALGEYHRAALRATTANWVADTQKAGGRVPEYLLPPSARKGSPQAASVMPLAMTKAVTEMSILRAITRDADSLGAVMDEPTWNKIAQQHFSEAKLDDRSVSLIRRQTDSLFAAADGSQLSADAKLGNLLNKLQLSVALDTVRDEYMIHSKLHAWLIALPVRSDVNLLNERVYAELFLTPKSDQWLGLLADDVYTALDGGGVVREER